MANDINSVLLQIKKIRAAAWIGKKKHYNAADWKDGLNLWFGAPAMVINVVVGSLLIGLLSETFPNEAKWWAAVAVLVAAVLTAVQTFFNFQKQAEGHRRIASRYLILANDCSSLLALLESGNTPKNIIERMDALSIRYNEITQDSDACPVSNADYKKAIAGIKDGEEHFTEIELGKDK